MYKQPRPSVVCVERGGWLRLPAPRHLVTEDFHGRAVIVGFICGTTAAVLGQNGLDVARDNHDAIRADEEQSVPDTVVRSDDRDLAREVAFPIEDIECEHGPCGLVANTAAG